MNIKSLTVALNLFSYLHEGNLNKNAYKKFNPVSIRQDKKGFYINISSPFNDFISEKTLGEFLEFPIKNDRTVIDNYQKVLSSLPQEVKDIPFDLNGKHLVVFLDNATVASSAGMSSVEGILPAEVLKSFQQSLITNTDFSVASLSALKTVNTKFNTDEYGLIVGPDGTFYYMNPVNNIIAVQQGYKVSLDDEGKIIRKDDFANNIVLTDATNSRLVVSNTDGNLVGIDLRGYRQFTTTSALILLSNKYITPSYTMPDGMYTRITNALKEIDIDIATTTWSHWFLYLSSRATIEMQNIQKELEVYWKASLKKSQEELKLSYYQYLTNYMPYLISLLYYGKKIPVLLQDRNNKEVKPFDTNLSNLDGVEGYLPHQLDVLSKTQKSNLNILQVGTGGGKSIITISDIVAKLKAGKIKKPLVLMPTKLIGQYASEIYKFSKNEINVFTYSNETIINYRRAYNGEPDAITKADKNLPTNTIYLCGYNLLKSSKSWDGRADKTFYLGKPVEVFPIAEYLAKQGFDAVYMDEAHKLKNETGKLTGIVRSLLTSAKEITCMSGTLIYNSVNDLKSILSLCAPEANTYDLEADGYLKPMEQLGITFIAKKERDWAAFLPKFKDYLVSVDLQDDLMEAYKNAEKDVFTQIQNDPMLAKYQKYLTQGVDATMEIDDDDEEQLQKIMFAHFQKLEQIINAPDLMGYNAVSPKVKAFDDIVDAHEKGQTYQGIDFTNSKDKKIFAYGINKVVSEEIMKWSKHKDIMVHYSSGDKGAITKFLTDPKIKILIADITSIAEGFNFQLADTVIKVQVSLTPGQDSQAVARVFRPKVGDASRPVVNSITLAVNDTVDMIKFARLLYKKTQANSIYNANDKDYQQLVINYGLDKLPKVSLSLKSITEFENRVELERLGFFTAATAYNVWNSATLEKSKQKLIKETATRLGISPEQVDLSKDLLIPVSHDKEITGSKKVWTCKPNGFTNGGNLLTLEQAIINFLDSYEGEKGTEKKATINFFKGKEVFTTFGKGNIYEPSIHNSCPASLVTIDNKNIRLANSEILVLDELTDLKSLEEFKAKPAIPVVPVSEFEDDENDIIDDSSDVENAGLEMFVGIVNNQPALVDVNGYDLKGFKELGPVVYTKILTKSAFAKIKNYVENSKLSFNEEFMHELDKAQARFLKNNVRYASEASLYPKIKIWQRRQLLPQKEGIVEPFITSVNDEIFLIISVKHSRKAKQLVGKKIAPGTTNFKLQKDFSVMFVKGPNNANKQLKIIERLYGLVNAEEVYSQANLIKLKGKM